MKCSHAAVVALSILAALAALGLLATLPAACSSNGNASNPGPACDPCDSPDAGDSGAASVAAAHVTNPDGVPYPSPAGGYGRSARYGNIPGSVMQNFQFLGYPGGDRSAGLQTIALADYYDPCGKRYKVLHLTVAGIWCPNCQVETAALVAEKASLETQGIVLLQALSDGKTEGVAATPSDLDTWVNYYHVDFDEVLDPGLKNLGVFFPASAIPWNADLDARTMEILDVQLGAELDGSVASGLDLLPAQPGYPIPAVCGDQ
jgi:hypothetical protein